MCTRRLAAYEMEMLCPTQEQLEELLQLTLRLERACLGNDMGRSTDIEDLPSVCIVAIGEIGKDISSTNFYPIKIKMFTRHRQFHELWLVLFSGSIQPKLTEEIALP